MGFKRKQMQALTLHIELFALQRLLFRFYNLLCRTARCAQRSVPDLNLICTNIFMRKVLRKNNFSSNHNTSKNFTAKIQQLFQNASEKGGRLHPTEPTASMGFTLRFIKTFNQYKNEKTIIAYCHFGRF